MKNKIFVWVLLISLALLAFSSVCYAENETKTNEFIVEAVGFEGADSSKYEKSNMTVVGTHCYGAKSLGTVNIIGNDFEVQEDDSMILIGTDSPLEVWFSFAKDLQDGWQIVSESEKNVNGVDLSSKIKNGAAIIQQSVNGSDWDTLNDSVTDFFSSEDAKVRLFAINENNYRAGMYYRVQIAYKVGRIIGEDGWWLWKDDTYEYRDCVDEYVFRVADNSLSIDVFELDENSNPCVKISDDTYTVVNGFSITNNIESQRVTVSLEDDDNSIFQVRDSISVYAAGDYLISVCSLLGSHKEIRISVDNDLQNTILLSSKYEGDTKYKYSVDNPVETFPNGWSIGTVSLLGAYSEENTLFKLSSPAKLQFVYNGRFDNISDNQWEVARDDTKKVNGIKLSEPMQSGVIIVQKSTDNKKWETVFEKENIIQSLDSHPFYVLNPSDYYSGCYYRVIVANKIQSLTGTSGILFWEHNTYDTKQCVEVYSFFAQSSSYIPVADSSSNFGMKPIGWVILVIALILVVLISIFLREERRTIGIAFVVLGTLALLFAFAFKDGYTPTNEEIVQARTNYLEAFEQSKQINDYTAEIEMSVKKKAFIASIGMTMKGTIQCSEDGCQGAVKLDIPQNKRDCTFKATSKSSEISKLYLSDTTALDLPFNIVNIGEGIVVTVPEEVLDKGRPTSNSLTDLQIKLTNDDVYLLYGDMIEYFILVADAMTLDITEMKFTSATLSITFSGGAISGYNCSMTADTNMGEIECSFIENIYR